MRVRPVRPEDRGCRNGFRFGAPLGRPRGVAEQHRATRLDLGHRTRLGGHEHLSLLDAAQANEERLAGFLGAALSRRGLGLGLGLGLVRLRIARALLWRRAPSAAEHHGVRRRRCRGLRAAEAPCACRRGEKALLRTAAHVGRCIDASEEAEWRGRRRQRLAGAVAEEARRARDAGRHGSFRCHRAEDLRRHGAQDLRRRRQGKQGARGGRGRRLAEALQGHGHG
mmetsp:Transcript_76785/g.221861  ORF Transcript_76785/g.221861 Transcript_76785/m.221861 type:complete len:225 (+) Transcript_76785:298-972(+)